MKEQNPWLRNYVAFIGLLGSIRPEIIYMETLWDKDGIQLSGKNDYILKGIPPTCRYWSFVIYDFNNRRMEPFEETVASSYRTPLLTDGTYEIILTAHPENYPGKQTINHGGNDYTITMRIYGPEQSYYENKDSIPIGTISKVNP